MEPTIRQGDLIVATLGRGAPRPGDVVVLRAPVGVVVHRVVAWIRDATGRTYYRTAGDANRREDIFLMPREAIVGVVRARLPGLGYPSLWAALASAALAKVVRRPLVR